MKCTTMTDNMNEAVTDMSESFNCCQLKALIQPLIYHLNTYSKDIHVLQRELKKVAKVIISESKNDFSFNTSTVENKEPRSLGYSDTANVSSIYTNKILIEKHDLSKRELETLDYVLLGKTSKQIAKELEISFRTVEFHLTKLKLKMGARSRSELIEKAMMVLREGDAA